MNKFFKCAIVVALAVLTMVGSGCTNIKPGYTGIVINKLGSNRGVNKSDVVQGLVFYIPGKTQIDTYPTFQQRVVWTASPNEGKAMNEELTFQTKDSVPVSLDVAVNYTLRADKVPEFYNQFRLDDIRLFTHGYMRDQARNAVAMVGSEYTFDEVNGPKKEEFFGKVNAYLSKAVEIYGVTVPVNGLTSIGAPRPPETLKAAIAQRAQAIQESITAENQLRTTKANAAKAEAESIGKANANRALASSITPQILELKKIELEQQRIARWNGVYPTTMMGGATPLVTIK